MQIRAKDHSFRGSRQRERRADTGHTRQRREQPCGELRFALLGQAGFGTQQRSPGVGVPFSVSASEVSRCLSRTSDVTRESASYTAAMRASASQLDRTDLASGADIVGSGGFTRLW